MINHDNMYTHVHALHKRMLAKYPPFSLKINKTNIKHI